MIRVILQLSKWKKCRFDFWTKIFKIQNYVSQIYTKNVKNVSNSHSTLYIHNFLSLENVEISMQVSNRQFFHRNDVETTSFRGTISGILLVPQKRLVECLPKIYFFIIYYNLYLKSKAVGWSYIPSTALTKKKVYPGLNVSLKCMWSWI